MVIDLVMPGLSGVDTIRLARCNRPDLKVLFASGYADMSRFAESLGHETLVKKPFTLETLAAAVRAALRKVPLPEPNSVAPQL